eukprot:scaffold1708_cov189-Chaetoceros_neogracile.AAC.4
MGYLKGLGWVSCKKCKGNGGHATKSGTIVNCSTCNGTAQVKKRHWYRKVAQCDKKKPMYSTNSS